MTKEQELAIQLLGLLEKREKQYAAVNKQIRGLQGDFPSRIHVMDDSLWDPVIKLLDQILGGEDIASYYYFECRNMKNGGMIVEKDVEWRIKTLEDISAYVDRRRE